MAKQIAYNMDCMEAMREMPDKAFELAIVDPPYGIGIETSGTHFKQFKTKGWDNSIPSEEYFKELFRVSQNQVIWGGNYFSLMPCRGFIFWDKTPMPPSFAAGEYAWTSFNCNAKKWNGKTGNETSVQFRIHPTQKPVALYQWLLKNYAKPGDKILDTHLGSGSSRIAAYNLGFDFVGYEIDPDYFKAQEERFKKHTAQTRLIDFVEQKPEQINLLQV